MISKIKVTNDLFRVEDISIRPLIDSPEDAVKVIHLDKLCPNGSQKIGPKVYSEREHIFSRSSQFVKSFMLIAESDKRAHDDDSAVGIIAGGIHELYKILPETNQKLKIKGGHIFDLKVHPQYRRNGVARRLIREIQALLIQEGAEYLHCDVGEGNFISQKLFHSEGFEEQKVEVSYGWFLSYEQEEDPEIQRHIRQLNKEEAAQTMLKLQSNTLDIDQFPVQPSEIINNINHITTLYCNIPGKGEATVSLWDSGVSVRWVFVAPLYVRFIIHFLHYGSRLLGFLFPMFPDFASLSKLDYCYLYGVYCSGPEGENLLHQLVFKAHNLCKKRSKSMLSHLYLKKITDPDRKMTNDSIITTIKSRPWSLRILVIKLLMVKVIPQNVIKNHGKEAIDIVKQINAHNTKFVFHDPRR